MAECPQALGQGINVGSGQEISIGELAQMIMKLVGAGKPVESDEQRLHPKDSKVERLCADNSKARVVLNWYSQHALQDGFTLTIAWMGEHLKPYRAGMYTI